MSAKSFPGGYGGVVLAAVCGAWLLNLDRGDGYSSDFNAFIIVCIAVWAFVTLPDEPDTALELNWPLVVAGLLIVGLGFQRL